MECEYGYFDMPGNLKDYLVNKDRLAKDIATYFLARLQSMFEYKNLPDTIGPNVLDRFVMVNGISCITDVNDKLYVFRGNLGGVQDVYYRPTRFIIANPHIANGFTKEAVVLGEEPHTGVLIRNDTEWIGMLPMIARYSYMLAENYITLRIADINLRINALLSASTSKELAGALEYLHDVEDGKLGVIQNQPFFDGVKMQSPPSNNGSYLTQFIELHQYLTGSFYNEVGLLANYNMKREAIGTGETTLNQDMLLPLCENMLKCRREDLKKVNEMYGTNISVDFSSSWKHNQVEQELEVLATASELTGSSKSSNFTPGFTPDSQLTGSGSDGDVQVGSGMSQPESGVSQLESGMEQAEAPDEEDKLADLIEEEATRIIEDLVSSDESSEEINGSRDSSESEDEEDVVLEEKEDN